MTAAEAKPKFKLRLKLQPKQDQLFNAVTNLSGPCVIGFGGSRGAAKSGGVRRIAIFLASAEPGIVIWIIRRVWDDLKKNHIDQLFREYPELQQFWIASARELRIPVGDPAAGLYSSIFFVHAGLADRAKKKARGPEAHYIFIDQAEEFTQAEIEQYDGSNRGPGKPPGFCKKVLTFNPGGVGTAYLRRVMWKREFMDNEDPGNFMFIQGYGWDNFEWFRGIAGGPTESEFYGSWDDKARFELFITETDFGRKLNALPPAQRIGELMGDFENFSGQYFAEVFEQCATVLPIETVAGLVKPWWKRWIATDWGFSHYSATGWFASGLVSVEEIADIWGVPAIAPVRMIIMYRELVANETTEPDLAKVIAMRTSEQEKKEVRYHFFSPDAWAKRGSAHTVVEQMEPIFSQSNMPRLNKADNDRVGGWRLLYNCFGSARRLTNWAGGSFDPFNERHENAPALFISAACTEAIAAIPMLVSDYDAITRPNGDPKDVRKVAGQISDDVADMLRYGLKSYLTADATLPADEERRQIAERYLARPKPGAPNAADANMTALNMRMKQLDAEQRDENFLRRRMRGR